MQELQGPGQQAKVVTQGLHEHIPHGLGVLGTSGGMAPRCTPPESHMLPTCGPQRGQVNIGSSSGIEGTELSPVSEQE